MAQAYFQNSMQGMARRQVGARRVSPGCFLKARFEPVQPSHMSAGSWVAAAGDPPQALGGVRLGVRLETAAGLAASMSRAAVYCVRSGWDPAMDLWGVIWNMDAGALRLAASMSEAAVCRDAAAGDAAWPWLSGSSGTLHAWGRM